MQHVRWTSRPQLRQPVLLAAFEGWNDAGDAASGAVRYLRDRWEAEPFAEIDPEDFYDFTSTRPMVRLTDDMTREIVWPTNQFSATRVPNGPDVILLLGHEPQLKWPTFCRQVTDIARAYGTKLVVTLGALLAEVAHTRPVAVTGTAYDPEVEASLRLQRSRYEGPTGIVGVLHDACRKAGLRSGSLWAAVPTYVPGAPSPKATLALVEHLTKLLDITLTTTDLEIASASYERQINELVADDEETAEYVTRLEERHDSGDDDDELPSLIEEVERFLREQPGD
jgi:proteasome assembly chaperone (PAC2) family protein